MSSDNRVVLCTYRYDATDRLADCSPAGQGSARFFYLKNRLTTQIQGQIQHTALRTDEHLLAHLSVENSQSDSALLVTDQQQSVIAAQSLAFAYTPYGHRHPSAGPMNLPGYTGQRLDPVTGHYLLGNGYRAYNPVLMRFNSPDSLSPFGLVIDAHGFPQSAPEFPALKIRGGSVSADLLDYRLRQKNVDLSRYENIRVLSCYSGDGGANSFSTNLASLTGLPVKGYKGKVILRKVGNIHSLEDITLVGFHKENIFRRGGGLYRNFEYSPIWSSAL